MNPWLYASAGYWVVMAITPGPNNILLANSGLVFGIRATLPLILGVQAGVFIQNMLVGTGLGAVFAAEARLQLLLKAAGTAYVLWLAWRSWSSSRSTDRAADRPVGFWAAAAFQFANPKSWLASTASVSAFLDPTQIDLRMIAALALVALVVGTPCSLLWAMFGVSLKRLLERPRALLVVNRSLAALLAFTGLLFWIPS